MSSESRSTPSEPPHASRWAAPPEFYIDANLTGKSIRAVLEDLGYVVHTPEELYGSRALAEGADDDDWLPRVGKYKWSIVGRDLKILERPHELAAYEAAKVHMFLLPNNTKRDELIALLRANLLEMCTEAMSRKPRVWRLTRDGLKRLSIASTRSRRT